ncbi:kinase-like domain-containing protein [Russula vinacea]|nr:kinase-like domain-containing protein [Russula vinacea]
MVLRLRLLQPLSQRDWDTLEGLQEVLEFLPVSAYNVNRCHTVLSRAIIYFEKFMTKWEKLGEQHQMLKPWTDIGVKWATKYYDRMDKTNAYVITMCSSSQPFHALVMDRKSVGDKIHQIVEDLDFGCHAPVPRPEEPGIVTPVPDPPSNALQPLVEWLQCGSKLSMIVNLNRNTQYHPQWKPNTGGIAQANKNEFPMLFDIAMDYLPIQATSVPCECVFSSAKETDTAKRNKITPELMEILQLHKFSIKKEHLRFTAGWSREELEAEIVVVVAGRASIVGVLNLPTVDQHASKLTDLSLSTSFPLTLVLLNTNVYPKSTTTTSSATTKFHACRWLVQSRKTARFRWFCFLGSVYLGKDIKTGGEVAVKIGHIGFSPSKLSHEHDVYKKIAGSTGISPIHWKTFFSASQMVHSMYHYVQTYRDLTRLVPQLSAVESLHTQHYIHCDIKPGNFMIRVDSDDSLSVFLIDFGVAQLFCEPTTYLHNPYSTNHPIVGTLPFITGKLPWASRVDKTVLRKKSSITVEELCKGLPAPFCKLSIVSLPWLHEMPDYQYLHSVLLECSEQAKTNQPGKPLSILLAPMSIQMAHPGFVQASLFNSLNRSIVSDFSELVSHTYPHKTLGNRWQHYQMRLRSQP